MKKELNNKGRGPKKQYKEGYCSVVINHQQKVINRLSRKIQKLKSGTFSISEINKMLYCFDYVANECGYDWELAKIYEKLYAYRERLKNEKKGF